MTKTGKKLVICVFHMKQNVYLCILERHITIWICRTYYYAVEVSQKSTKHVTFQFPYKIRIILFNNVNDP